MAKVKRVAATNQKLLEVDGAAWSGFDRVGIDLIPAPVTMAASVSGQMALSQNHGKVRRVEARLAHNGQSLSVRLSWQDAQRDDQIGDLDRFVDGAAVMFPLQGDANPFTMGDAQHPVNAWLWRADQPEPFDVIARGYSTSQRRPASSSQLEANALYRDGGWHLVFQRPLQPGNGEFTRFAPGEPARIAFAIWEGSNAERAGQKAISGAFVDLELEA
ncbi:MAG: ethylbenzene dehydrogenase [Deltaproteobacteria bacterium]|nr:ethylbenzene dehydrogenase [Deltaproteobacteria bacterium]MBW2396012.1 ethylbenzene dehydrogenase [Deltaproteobacteria bacterium]